MGEIFVPDVLVHNPSFSLFPYLSVFLYIALLCDSSVHASYSGKEQGALPLLYPLIVPLFFYLSTSFSLSLPLFLFLCGVCFFAAQSPRLMLPWRRRLLYAVCTLPDSGLGLTG